MIRCGLGVVLALALAGCFSHAKAPGTSLSVMREAPLAGDYVLDHAGDAEPWPVARFDPASAVRFNVNGKWTPWMHAGELEVSDDGIVFGAQTLEWATANVVRLRGVDDEALLGFAACLPARETDGSIGMGGTGPVLAAALQCVETAQQKVGAPVPGRWDVTFGSGQQLNNLTFEQLRAGVTAGFSSGAGLLYSDVAQVEVSNFNASLTAVTVLVVAALLTGGIAAGGSGCSGGNGCGGGSCGNWGDGDGAPPTVSPGSPALMAGLGTGTPSLTNRRRLFTEDEARRSTARFLGWVDLTTRLEAARFVSVTPFVGARLAEVFEVGAGLSLYWGEPLRGTPVQNTPLGVPESPQVPHVMPAFRVLLNFELDPYRRVSLPLGADLAFGFDGAMQVRLRWGLRLRIWRLRAGFYPFTATWSDGLGTLTPPWTFPSTFEVGTEW